MAEKQAEQTKPEQEKKEGGLEKKISIWQNLSSESKEAGQIALGAGALGVATAVGSYDWLTIAGGFPVGGFLEKKLARNPEPFTSKDFAKESGAGLFFAPFPWGVLETIKQVPQAYGIDTVVNALGYSIPTSAFVIGGLTLATLPLLNAVYYPIKYFFDNGTFKGMGKDFKSGGEYWKGTKRSMLYLGLPTAATVAAFATVPWLAPWFYPAVAGLGIAYRLALSKKELNYSKLFYAPLVPIYAAGALLSGAATTVYKTAKGVKDATYAIGSALFEKLDKWFAPLKVPAAAQQAPAGAK